jgi:predicted deacylase
VGIETAIRLCTKINPKDLNGTLIVVPVVNMPSFQTRTPYVCPIDGLNINRIFPGKPNGSMSHRIAYTLFSEVISKANYVIDLHGGDLYESIIPFVAYYKTGKQNVDQETSTLCKLFETEYIWETSSNGNGWVPDGTLFAEATKKGIPAILAEAGGEGKLEERYVSILFEGVLNVMKYLNMVEGKPRISKQKVVRNGNWAFAKHGGIFQTYVKAGSKVSKGDILGEIRNIYGEKIDSIVAATSGVILMLIINPAVNTGDALFILAET